MKGSPENCASLVGVETRYAPLGLAFVRESQAFASLDQVQIASQDSGDRNDTM